MNQTVSILLPLPKILRDPLWQRILPPHQFPGFDRELIFPVADNLNDFDKYAADAWSLMETIGSSTAEEYFTRYQRLLRKEAFSNALLYLMEIYYEQAKEILDETWLDTPFHLEKINSYRIPNAVYVEADYYAPRLRRLPRPKPQYPDPASGLFYYRSPTAGESIPRQPAAY